MAEVASNHVGDKSRSHDNDHLAEPTPSFTAVNGSTSPAPPAKSKPDHENHKEISEVTKNRPILPNNHQEALEPPAPPRQERPSHGQDPVRHERRLSPAPSAQQAQVPTYAPAPTPTPHHAQPMDRPPSNASQRPEMYHEQRTQYPAGHSRTPSNQQHNGAIMSPQAQKRKRSFDGEHDRRAEYEHQVNSVYPPNGPPPSPGGPRMHSIENGPPRDRPTYSPHQTYPPPPESYAPPPDAYAQAPPMRDSPPEIYPRPERHQLVRNDYDQPVDPSIAPAQPRPYYSEQRMAESLQQHNRSYDSMPPRDNYGTPEEEDDQHGQYGEYGTNRSSQDLDRKRRKRVFSNRTKTGCMTCRRRKKKCDEQHPECKFKLCLDYLEKLDVAIPGHFLPRVYLKFLSFEGTPTDNRLGNNCLRGGFVCEGYSMRNTWQKPANSKQPIPLQSKNGYLPPQDTPSRAPYPHGSRYQETSPEYPGPPPQHMQNHQQSYEGDQRKPINVEDDRDQIYGRASTPDQQKPAWAKTSRPYPSNPPHMSKYQENGHRGSTYEMAADPPELNSMHPPPVHRTNSSASQYSQAPHPANQNNTPPNHNNVQAIAQAAATHPAALRPSPQRRHDHFTEREKMLKGLYYLPLTPALTEDRERCIQALWRFNNATNPSHGASPEERCRLFRQIINLRPTPEPPLPNGEVPRQNMDLPFGSVGERVVVEAPFNCDYGYNITVGDDVLIGADCRISDTCSVTIGARCIFSPNVKLVCATYPIDPRRRMGSNGPALGRNIVIEEDCWIGSNVTILAGVRVGKSSTVGAGSLLHQVRQELRVGTAEGTKTDRCIGCSEIHSRSRQSCQGQPWNLRRKCRRPVKHKHNPHNRWNSSLWSCSTNFEMSEFP